METKRCTRCGEEFPATVEYFPPQKGNSSGLFSWCRECSRKDGRERKARDYADPVKREKLRTQRRESRALAMQDPVKQEKRRAGNRASNAQAMQDPVKREKRTTQSRESAAQARQDPVKREKHRAGSLASNARAMQDPEKHEKKLAQQRESMARMRQDPVRREKRNAQMSIVRIRREARKRNLPDDFTQTDYENMLLYFGPTCAICGRVVMPNHPTLKLAVDHWIALNDPREDNPGTVVTNLLPICHGKGGCNNKKGDKDPVAWLMEAFGEVKAAVILQHIQAYFTWAESLRGQPNTQTD